MSHPILPSILPSCHLAVLPHLLSSPPHHPSASRLFCLSCVSSLLPICLSFCLSIYLLSPSTYANTSHSASLSCHQPAPLPSLSRLSSLPLYPSSLHPSSTNDGLLSETIATLSLYCLYYSISLPFYLLPFYFHCLIVSNSSSSTPIRPPQLAPPSKTLDKRQTFCALCTSLSTLSLCSLPVARCLPRQSRTLKIFI